MMEVGIGLVIFGFVGLAASISIPFLFMNHFKRQQELIDFIIRSSPIEMAKCQKRLRNSIELHYAEKRRIESGGIL